MMQLGSEKVALIAYEGNIDQMVYVVPVEKVELFMERFNDHGHWHIVGDGLSNFYLPMGANDA